MTHELFTIGHSNHSIENFLNRLFRYEITVVCDVRSNPYSRFNSHFNRELLYKELKNNNMEYVFLGQELGARSDDPSCYDNGKVQYRRLAKTELFQKGIERLMNGIKKFRIVLMCAEKDPTECHRTILISRYLRKFDILIKHILEDGSIENNNDLEKRLARKLWNKLPIELTDTPEDIIQRAYELCLSGRAAYRIYRQNSMK